ncbi:hypothetical protein EMIT0111MI5_30165 [Burkholderia sp. IT-111MI5]
MGYLMCTYANDYRMSVEQEINPEGVDEVRESDLTDQEQDAVGQ